MISAQSAGELPRGRTQAYNIRRQSQKEKLMASMGAQRYDGSACKDMLFVVMQQSKNAEKGECFVQEVTCAPEPMAVHVRTSNLMIIVRFCVDPFNFAFLVSIPLST